MDGKTINWRSFVTVPMLVEAAEIGVDINIEGGELAPGDFLIRTDPLSDEVFHCPRAEFEEHYQEVLDGPQTHSTGGQPADEGGQEPVQEGPRRARTRKARTRKTGQGRRSQRKASAEEPREVADASKTGRETGEEEDGPGFTCAIEKQGDGTATARARSRRVRRPKRQQASADH